MGCLSSSGATGKVESGIQQTKSFYSHVVMSMRNKLSALRRNNTSSTTPKEVDHKLSCEKEENADTIAQKRREWVTNLDIIGSTQEGSNLTLHEQMETALNDMGDCNTRIDRAALEKLVLAVIGRIDDLVFEKMFALFDVDSDGYLERNDCLIAVAFLAQHGSNMDKVELAFRLFDLDSSGEISQTEFNAMVISIVSNKLKYTLQTEHGRKAFKAHMQSEWSAESIEFWESVTALSQAYGWKETNPDLLVADEQNQVFSSSPAGVPAKMVPDEGKDKRQHCAFIPLSVAQTVFEQFIPPGAPKQINIAANTYERIADAMKRAHEDGEQKVPIDSFLFASREIMQLMEQDAFERFKQRMVHQSALHQSQKGEDGGVNYAKEAWAQVSLKESENMPLETFRKWAAQNPQYFIFLDELEHVMDKASQDEQQGDSVENQNGLLRQKSRRMLNLAANWHSNSDLDSKDSNSAEQEVKPPTDHEEDKSEVIPMPKRLYYRRPTSLVSMSIEADEGGNPVRVLTVGLGDTYKIEKRSRSALASTSSARQEKVATFSPGRPQSSRSLVSSRDVTLEEVNFAITNTSEALNPHPVTHSRVSSDVTLTDGESTVDSEASFDSRFLLPTVVRVAHV